MVPKVFCDSSSFSASQSRQLDVCAKVSWKSVSFFLKKGATPQVQVPQEIGGLATAKG